MVRAQGNPSVGTPLDSGSAKKSSSFLVNTCLVLEQKSSRLFAPQSQTPGARRVELIEQNPRRNLSQWLPQVEEQELP